ncbi:hypothetical protein ACLUX0_03145 [Limosilactobacillus mucosae]
MRIGYLVPVNPERDKKAWSGTYYSIFQQLEKMGFNVEWISYDISSLKIKLAFKRYQLKNGFKVDFFRDFLHSWDLSRIRAISIRQKLDDYDLIVCPGQSEVLASITTKTPILYYSDATVPLMTDYYWFGMKKKTLEESKQVEKKALENAKYRVFASHWATDSVTSDYSIDNNVFILPFDPGISVKNNIRGKKKINKNGTVPCQVYTLNNKN